MISLEELQNRHRVWAAHNFPGSIGSADLSLLGVIEELGELAHAQLKGKQSIRHTPEEIIAMKVDALADIMVFMADYANREGLSLQAALDKVWPDVEKRDWIKWPANGKDK